MILKRAQREDILGRVLGSLLWLTKRRVGLFPDKTWQDLLDDVGVEVWVAIWKYRHKPYDDAFKLAMRSGRNRLISRVRRALIQRGTRPPWLPLEGLDWEPATAPADLSAMLEALTKASLWLVGPKRAALLLQATTYEHWTAREVLKSKTQRRLLQRLGVSRAELVQLLNRLRVMVRLAVLSSEPVTTVLVEGVWKQRGIG